MLSKFYYFLFSCCFTCSLLSAQAVEVEAGRGNFGFQKLHTVVTPENNQNFGDYVRYFNKLCEYEVFFDDYYFFKLKASMRLKDPYDSKDIILMPKYKMVIHKVNGALVFTPYKTYFKDGGFTRTGEKKMIHGVLAEKYHLSPSFLNMEIWVGQQEQSNETTDFLNELQLLEAIPKDEKVIAIASNHIEYSPVAIRYKKRRKDWLKFDFEGLLIVPASVQAERHACFETGIFDSLPIPELKDIPKTLKFKYKINYTTTSKDFYQDTEEETTTNTAYWNQKNNTFLQLYDELDTEGTKFLLFQHRKIAILGSITHNTFQITEAKKQIQEDCELYGTPLLIGKRTKNDREISTYITSDKLMGSICMIELDEKSKITTSRLFGKYNLPKGEILNIHTITQAYRSVNEIKTEKSSKKIKLNVQN